MNVIYFGVHIFYYKFRYTNFIERNKFSMETKYSITNIHLQLLTCLENGKDTFQYINDIDELRLAIRLAPHNSTNIEHILAYLSNKDITLKPIVPDQTISKNNALYNIIAIRELIAQESGFKLHHSISDLFYFRIINNLELIKNTNIFHVSYSNFVSELTAKREAHITALEKKEPFKINSYLDNKDENIYPYFKSCQEGAASRYWLLTQQDKVNFPFNKQQYMRIDQVFGLVYLFNEHLADYSTYYFASLKKATDCYYEKVKEYGMNLK